MPKLDDIALEVDPISSPLEYPGIEPPWPTLLVNDVVLRLLPAPGRRLGQYRALVDTSSGELQRVEGRCVPLSYVLLMLNAAPVDARWPILAVGSNASPAQLRRKLIDTGVSMIVPMVPAAITGICVAHSAHVSKHGYVPATPVVDRDARSDFFVLWLDRQQLDAIDSTEPNYRRVRMPADCRPRLPSGEVLTEVGLYASRWGVLRYGAEPLSLLPQRELISALIERSDRIRKATGTSPEAFAQACASSQQLRDTIRATFEREGWVHSDGLPPPHDRLANYGNAESNLDAPGDGWLAVRPTPDDLERNGEACVVMYGDDAVQVGDAAVVPAHGGGPQAIARVVRAPGVSPGAILVDQVVRNAVGVEIGEHIRLQPAVVPPSRVGDMLMSSRRYLTCRVQSADLTVVEQPVCLLDRLTLEILGVESGDIVVIEGMPTQGTGNVPTVRLKAFESSEDIVQRRHRLQGGGSMPGSRPPAMP